MYRIGLADIWLVYRLQRKGVRLDVRSAVLEPASPFRLVLPALLSPWHTRVVTIPLRRRDQGRRQSGFLQLRWRSSLPAMDLLYIAPSLEHAPGVTWFWKHLLQRGAEVAGAAGAQRLFAHVPAERHAEIEVLRQSGFALYAQDRLFRLDPPWPRDEGTTVPRHWTPQFDVDTHGVEQLYRAITPAVVQQAEAMGSNGDGAVAGSWWGETREGCYVVRPGPGEVLGYLRLTRGQRGHWLKIVLHPELSDRADALVCEALSLMRTWPQRPIFCDVREYEGYVGEGLQQQGFRPVMTRRLLVRHTTVPVRVPERQRVRVLNGSREHAPTMSVEQMPSSYPFANDKP